MGLFDRIVVKKNSPAERGPAEAAPSGGVLPQLAAARERLESKDLPGALAVYEQVLAAAGDRADVLVAISGDLGSTGHVRAIIELIAPRYDAERHGPATGLNILQAYLAVRDVDAARHVLDILFALKRPELEERLHGFSNALAEMIEADHHDDGAPRMPKINLITVSKPIWFYGLELIASEILPPKEGPLRGVAFTQLALPDVNPAEAAKQAAEELGRLTRALPLWLAETFYFSPLYAPIAAVGVLDDGYGNRRYGHFGAEWTTDNLRQLTETAGQRLDYVFTGALRDRAGDYELTLRVWDMKKFRERKVFTARWTPATAEAELAKLHEAIRAFMEWTAETRGLHYAPPAQPRAWLDALDISLGLFLLEKNLLPKEQMPQPDAVIARTAPLAAGSEAAALALITLRNRAAHVGLAAPGAEASLPGTALVAHARQAVK